MDAAGRPEFERAGHKVTLRAERASRVRLLNRILAVSSLSVRDWGGNSYVLSNASGKTRNIYGLSALWSAADEIGGSTCDPLDPIFVTTLERCGEGEER
ncbi:MAG: hypothetical protein AB7G35_19735 [Hyphomicrobiaceae bacterium]